jgi:2-polyprenyl-3-methyl-5-hydroxy-6-metoxy-1,4-benzoquinol methylase
VSLTRSPPPENTAVAADVCQDGRGINVVAGASCLLCAGALRRRHDFGEYSIAYCDSCQLGRLTPLPSEETLRALYGSRAYFEGVDGVGYADYEADAPQFARTFRAKLGALLRFGPVGDLLEIGCGPGYFLREARSAGVARPVGVDRNPWAIEEARRGGDEAHVGSIDVLAPERTFDAVVMLDLIEHIAEPVPFLEQVRRRLAPGGRVFLMTPNIRSLLARVAGERWVSFKIPEHLYYYSPRSMRSLLERCGFEVLSIRGAGQYVTVQFLLSRLQRLLPRSTALLAWFVRRLALEDRVVFVTNGSIDVVARAAER